MSLPLPSGGEGGVAYNPESTSWEKEYCLPLTLTTTQTCRTTNVHGMSVELPGLRMANGPARTLTSRHCGFPRQINHRSVRVRRGQHHGPQSEVLMIFHPPISPNKPARGAHHAAIATALRGEMNTRGRLPRGTVIRLIAPGLLHVLAAASFEITRNARCGP